MRFKTIYVKDAGTLEEVAYEFEADLDIAIEMGRRNKEHMTPKGAVAFGVLDLEDPLQRGRLVHLEPYTNA